MPAASVRAFSIVARFAAFASRQVSRSLFRVTISLRRPEARQSWIFQETPPPVIRSSAAAIAITHTFKITAPSCTFLLPARSSGGTHN